MIGRIDEISMISTLLVDQPLLAGPFWTQREYKCVVFNTSETRPYRYFGQAKREKRRSAVLHSRVLESCITMSAISRQSAWQRAQTSWQV